MRERERAWTERGRVPVNTKKEHGSRLQGAGRAESVKDGSFSLAGCFLISSRF